jgi:hypothetical protein
MKYGFRTRPYFRDSPPTRIATPGSTVATSALSNEVNVSVVLISRPVLLKIIKKGWPLAGQAVPLKVSQRERKAVVNAHQRRGRLGQAFDKPVGNRLASPVPA